MFYFSRKTKLTIIGCISLLLCLDLGKTHDAKDFDDTILYKIDFEMPDFDTNPNLKEHVRSFYTHDQEKYDCVIPPKIGESNEEIKTNEPELSPFTLLKPLIHNTPSCSYRIEAYWSYEICHGHHVRQYHEEREGKAIKFQEYYLGKWSDEKTEALQKDWEESRKAGMKYKTTKIDNIRYPFFEMEMSDGTLCDIINAPRTTIVRYVCYPHGKNEIYSFKETSSCNYEAIILTSALCVNPAFHPEESKEISIKCFNMPEEQAHKPLSMLRRELKEIDLTEDDDFPVPKELNNVAKIIAENAAIKMGKLSVPTALSGEDIDKLVQTLLKDNPQYTSGEETSTAPKQPPTTPVVSDISPLLEFIKGSKCLTGGSGWWKYEFCYGNYVRQFHKDKKSEAELFLGYFNMQAHRQWLAMNPDKRPQAQSSSIWHHYEKGSRCDRTGLPREVDVKLTCSGLGSMSPTAVSMYLLEPKTCQYILVFESPMVCMLMGYIDEYGLVDEANIQKIMQQKQATSSTAGGAGVSSAAPPTVDIRL